MMAEIVGRNMWRINYNYNNYY